MTTPISIVEVSPRDGLQNEAGIFSTSDKVILIEKAIAAGLRRIEAVSFVNPLKVPQMADAEAVMAAVTRRSDVTYIGLALNARGAQRAIAAGVDEINYAVIASDSYNMANQGCLTADTLNSWEGVWRDARQAGKRVTLTIGASFGCPYEGEVPIARVVDLARRGAQNEPDEIILADSIGAAGPTDVIQRIEAVRAAIPAISLRCHFHNTRNTGLANVFAAIQAGVRTFDASIGGIGGCPFSPNATGNIPTEDLAYMLQRMHLEGSLSLEGLIQTAKWLSERLNHPVPGLLSRAGLFPLARIGAQERKKSS